jgi:Sad1 / UNC-like C-terminal
MYSNGLEALDSWTPLANFTASREKGTQSFALDAAAALWVKYLLIRFLTHYGNEPVCAINDLRVFGKSAVEELEVCVVL